MVRKKKKEKGNLVGSKLQYQFGVITRSWIVDNGMR